MALLNKSYKYFQNTRKLFKVNNIPLYSLKTLTTFRNDVPHHVDILIIGGGVMGSSAAYWIKKRAEHNLNILVVERDPTYTCASTVLSVGGVRQQFSLPENIHMSIFGAEFLKNVRTHLGDECDVNFKCHGYLTLAEDSSAHILEQNFKIQSEHEVKNVLLTSGEINKRFPWINTDGIKLGCLGLKNEGWCDPWSLLNGLKSKALSLGATFLKGEVVGFTFKNMPPNNYKCTGKNGLDKVLIKTDNDTMMDITFDTCILAAGPNSGAIAELAKIGTGQGLLSVPLPIEPRKRYVYCFECKGDNLPTVGSPMLIDSTGMWFRKDGASYIAGKSPPHNNDPKAEDFEVDYDYFDREIWPLLANRVPAFDAVKVRSGWCGHYEYNVFDENGVIGRHPYYDNLFIASGFSGHGLQQGPAVGRALSELILDGRFVTIDLKRLGFDRLVKNEPMLEVHII